MSPKKSGEPKEVKGQCILQREKSNIIIQWTEEMKMSISLLCGVAGNFLNTNTRHEYPISREEYYLPVLSAQSPSKLKVKACQRKIPCICIIVL
jgi:hypothetical protein